MLILIVAILQLNGRAFGFRSASHANLTHTAIFNSVLEQHLENQLGLQQGLNQILILDQSVISLAERIPIDQFEDRISPVVPSNPTVLDLLKSGSRLEDIPNPRSKHHFYDPYRNAGLENKTEHPALAVAFSTATYVRYWGDNKFDLTGASSISRVLNTEDPKWEQEYENYFSWPDTRDYFYKALTQESKAAREHYLALTFLSFGHVMHLLEDLGVPAHTRNDFIKAHFRGLYLGGIGNPFEGHVEDEVKPSGIPGRWLEGWTPQAKVFSKLAHYWDVNSYSGQYVGTSPLSSWGFSEQTNYQFLSQSTIFRANDGTKYYFPQPNVNNVTGYVKPGVYYWNSAPVNHRYISGYGITHLARNKFVEIYAIPIIPYPVATVAYHTTFDSNVYEDYADITIPRTIDYATGLLNYFFRGSIEVSIGCPQGCNPETGTATYSMTITNTSINTNREQVLKGGTFEFYWQDLSGNRTEANDFTVYTYDEADPNTTELWDQDSVLPYGEHIKAMASFEVSSCTDVEDYAVVYKGAINDFEYPDDCDFDDPNAIACWVKSASFSVPASSYTLLVTEWGGTDEYYECAEYLKTIFDSENPDGYILPKTPDSSCFDCRWRFMDYHTCPYGSPYCYNSCNITQIMLTNSSATDEFCVIIVPFPVAYCGFGPLCNGSYKRCFSKQPDESYDDFWERLFNGGVFGDDSEIDCTEDGCIIPALGTWTDSWVRVIWIANP